MRTHRHFGPQPSALSPQPFRGFTLVEMLVSVALVLLMMTLFAQVFQIAGGSVSTQRGIMENDQRARSVQLLINSDLDRRTFRYVLPFALNEDVSDPISSKLNLRQGYFYVSENNGANGTDDVLAMTVQVKSDEPPYYGRALTLFPDPIPLGVAWPQRDDIFFRLNPNQPETDDARVDYNQSASSTAAEVVYFVRNGNLYRRQLLLRRPSDGDLTDEQPTDDSNNRFLSRLYNNPPGSSTYFTYPRPATIYDPVSASNISANGFSIGYDNVGTSQGRPANFWRHFDYSGHPAVIPDGSAVPTYYYDGVTFNGLSSLKIASSVPTFPYTTTAPNSPKFPGEIAYPPNRFGHNTINPTPLSSGPNPPFGGQPREYGVTGTNPWWVGRLTMEESSQSSVQYPMLTHQVPNSASDPANDFSIGSPWADSDGDGVVDAYAGGPWRGEDLLLTNVHSFDIKVWDEVLNSFVDLGHSLTNAAGAKGDFHSTLRKNAFYGPAGAASNVFDTWYPFRTEDINGNGNPFDVEDTNGNGLFDAGETDVDNDGMPDKLEDVQTIGAVDGQVLDFDADGSVTLLDTNSDGMVDAGENAPPYRPQILSALPGDKNLAYQENPALKRIERWVPYTSGTSRYVNSGTGSAIGRKVFPPVKTKGKAVAGDAFYYICIAEDTTVAPIIHSDYQSEPDWPQYAGGTVRDGDLTWQAVDNRKPLRAIQITLRFVDPTTSQMRTLTLQHSLVD